MTGGVKIDKYIGTSGFTSRRKAFDLIGEQRVTVNGKVANYSTKVQQGDVVMVDGAQLTPADNRPVVIAYNKPKGIICTSEKIPGNIIDAVNYPGQVYPVGRLDKDS